MRLLLDLANELAQPAQRRSTANSAKLDCDDNMVVTGSGTSNTGSADQRALQRRSGQVTGSSCQSPASFISLQA